MSLNVTYTWRCDFCGEETAEDFGAYQMGYAFLTPFLMRAGWHYLNGQMVCPKHKILVDPMENDHAESV